jgi:hypothetical protein
MSAWRLCGQGINEVFSVEEMKTLPLAVPSFGCQFKPHNQLKIPSMSKMCCPAAPVRDGHDGPFISSRDLKMFGIPGFTGTWR